MPAISAYDTVSRVRPARQSHACYHCGLRCLTNNISIGDKYFCCEGCKLVYEIINDKGLCDYYKLQDHPGIAQLKPARSDKYAFLDDEAICRKLYQFTNGDLAIVRLYIPSIHCSSCMWLLEHLNRMDAGIKESRITFTAREVTIHFSLKKTSLRNIVELLTTIGYEPYISLEHIDNQVLTSYNKGRIIKLGVAGFCFGNIMMMSFPEYLAGKTGMEQEYEHLFRHLNLFLSLPVFFYAATEFYRTAWAGLKQKILNIDAPIVLALIITFSRSVYEIVTNTGAGYLDSMSGIVFFMLVGRVVQERTYRSLSFTRDYKAYFPIAVNVSTDDGIVTRQLQQLKENDIVILHHDETIPADSLVVKGNAQIDYSFVTGEADPVTVQAGETVYAGGKQKGEELIIKVVRPMSSSYLTSLWNHYAFKKNKTDNNDRISVVHILSKYFTVILLVLAALTASYWYFHDPATIINSVSAMLIVACPCALLLSATFTNSNILRIFGLNGLFLRDATVIEQMAKTDHIVFDKTGTVTTGSNCDVELSGHRLTDGEKDLVYTVARQSNHPNSRAIVKWLGQRKIVVLDEWKEIAGQGLEASAGCDRVVIGAAALAGVEDNSKDKATAYIKINDKISAVHLRFMFRWSMPSLIASLQARYRISLLSGDNDRQRKQMNALFGSSEQLFDQKPLEKLRYIQSLQQKGEHVMMVGDGLNDAGALQQSNVGMTLTDDVNNFTPACDVICDAHNIGKLKSMLDLSRFAGVIIKVSFAISIVYNIAGLYFAIAGLMKPVVAAILMPCSTLSIVILSSGLSNLFAWKKGLAVSEG